MTGHAYEQSARDRRRMGPFHGYRDARCAACQKPVAKDNVESMLGVIELHRDAVEQIQPSDEFTYLKDEARKCWDSALEQGKKHGYRNAQVTVLAPTGTIGFLMDCDTTGIEPDIALVKYKLLAGGGMLKIVNRTVPPALQHLGYNAEEIERIIAHIEKHDTIEDVDEDGATISQRPEARASAGVRLRVQAAQRQAQHPLHGASQMMAAAQPFLSGAISKTVNMPEDRTVEDIMNAYVEGWKMGLKASRSIATARSVPRR